MPLAVGFLGSLAGLAPRHAGWVAGGAAVFVAMEYLIHRFLLHAPTSRYPRIARLQQRIHLGHHREPHNLDLVFLPLPLLLVLVPLFALGYHGLFGSPTITRALVCGNLAGLLYYEWVHFIAHVPVRPSTPWGRWMKKHHLLHHFQDERTCYGVTTPLGDMLFGTGRPQG